MTTYETKEQQIEAIRRGDLAAIKDWFDCRPQNEYAVEKLAAQKLLEKIGHREKVEPMSKEDLISRLLVCESALRVIHHTLECHAIGQAMVILTKQKIVPTCAATAYPDEDIEMIMGIADLSISMSSDKVVEFLQDLQLSIEKSKDCEKAGAAPPKKKKPPIRPDAS